MENNFTAVFEQDGEWWIVRRDLLKHLHSNGCELLREDGRSENGVL